MAELLTEGSLLMERRRKRKRRRRRRRKEGRRRKVKEDMKGVIEAKERQLQVWKKYR